MSTATDSVLAFVQFPHPGGEHGHDGDGVKEWNLHNHARKFMEMPAKYVSREGRQGPWSTGKGRVRFWGEWEPQSIVSELSVDAAISNGLPRYLHHPYLGNHPVGTSYQNSDPFVFGERFRYTLCRQYSRNSPTQLQRLAPHSVILFGSTQCRSFVLDTVFVVGVEQVKWTPATPPDADCGLMDRHHSAATIAPTIHGTPDPFQDSQLTLYGGVTYAERAKYHGMFSFVPCQAKDGSDGGFARPIIQLDGIINPASSRAARYNIREIGGDANRVADLWKQVVDQVLEQGCSLAHSIALPDWKRSEENGREGRDGRDDKKSKKLNGQSKRC